MPSVASGASVPFAIDPGPFHGHIAGRPAHRAPFWSGLFYAEFSSPWALDSPNPELFASIVLPHAECVLLFHILTEGRMLGAMPDVAAGEDGGGEM
jgi:hypothetical protein